MRWMRAARCGTLLRILCSGQMRHSATHRSTNHAKVATVEVALQLGLGSLSFCDPAATPAWKGQELRP
ncbi:hypothetical protein GW17_00061687 [Ensete ventricosum]|nr:hypothetical protein GW17_00061687 [Ensete ventricosum]